MIGTLFWNSSERRLRAGWRVVAEFASQVLAQFGLATLLGGVAVLLGHLPRLAISLNPVGELGQYPAYTVGSAAVELVAALVAVAVAARYLDRRALSELGLHLNRRWALDLCFGLALGAVLMAGLFGAERALGWITVTGHLVSNQPGHAFSLIMMMAALLGNTLGSLWEELVFRGYQIKNGAEGLNLPRTGPRLAVVLAWFGTALFFGAGHIPNPDSTVASTVCLSAIGLFFGLPYVLTGELGVCAGLHITWNFAQGRVFGFSVSGYAPSASFIAIAQTGPALWTGGTFGPEAGLVSLVLCGVGTLLVLCWVRLIHGRLEIARSLARWTPRAGT